MESPNPYLIQLKHSRTRENHIPGQSLLARLHVTESPSCPASILARIMW